MSIDTSKINITLLHFFGRRIPYLSLQSSKRRHHAFRSPDVAYIITILFGDWKKQNPYFLNIIVHCYCSKQTLSWLHSFLQHKRCSLQNKNRRVRASSPVNAGVQFGRMQLLHSVSEQQLGAMQETEKLHSQGLGFKVQGISSINSIESTLLPREIRMLPVGDKQVVSSHPLASSPSNLKGTGYGTLKGRNLNVKAAWSNRNKIRFPLSIDAAACPVWKNFSFNLTSESNFYGHWKMILSTIGFLGFFGARPLAHSTHNASCFRKFHCLSTGNFFYKSHSTIKN